MTIVLGSRLALDAELPASASSAVKARASHSGRRRKLMKPAPAISGGARQVAHLEPRDDFLRELARVRPALLGQHHRGIALVIAKARIARRLDRGQRGIGGVGERGAQASEQESGEGGHSVDQ